MIHWRTSLVALVVVVMLTGGCRSFPRAFKADYASDYHGGIHDLRRPVMHAQMNPEGGVNLSLCLFTEGLKPDSTVPGGPAWRFLLRAETWNPNERGFQDPFAREFIRPLLSPLMPDTVWLSASHATSVTDGTFLLAELTDLVSGTTFPVWAPIVAAGFPMIRDSDRHFFINPWLSPSTKGKLSSGARMSLCNGCSASFPRPPFDESSVTSVLSPDLWIAMDQEEVLDGPRKGRRTHGLLRLSDSTGVIHNYVPLVSASFPVPATDEDGLWAIRYVTTRAEFNGLLSQGNLGAHLPSLWVSSGLEPERAEERAKAFRLRIQESNSLFTLSGPGSLTDRGMIWIVVGSPDKVWKSHRTETWFFSGSDDGIPLRFDFDYTLDADGLPVWQLRRLPAYKPLWDRAVDRWRR